MFEVKSLELKGRPLEDVVVEEAQAEETFGTKVERTGRRWWVGGDGGGGAAVRERCEKLMGEKARWEKTNPGKGGPTVVP